MNMNWSQNLVLTTVFAITTVLGVSAQTTPYAEPTFDIVENHGTDKINLFTLVPSIEIPLYSKADPALGFSFSWSIPQNCYVGQYIDSQGHKHWSWMCYNDNLAFGKSTIAGPNPLFGSSSGYTTTTQCENGPYINVGGFSISTPDGQNHWVGGGVFGSTNCGPTSWTGATTDGSGYTLYASLVGYNTFDWKIWDRSGHYVTGVYEAGGGSHGLPTLENDSFGNSIQLTSQGYTDTLGVSGNFTSSGTGSNWDGAATYTWPDTNGNTTQLTMNTSGTDVVSRNLPTYSTSNPTCPQYEYPYGTQPNSFSSSIFSFPDGSTIALTPEQGSGGGGTTTGRIGSFTTRQGATISYTYGTSCAYVNNGGYLTRTDANGTTTYTLSGTITYPGGGGISGPATTTILDPGNNKTIYNWGMIGTGNPNVTATDPIITQVLYYQNTGTVSSPAYTLLKTVTICYNGATSNCVGATIVSYPITERDVYTTLGSMSTSSRIKETLDIYGNTTSITQYDFGASSPAFTTTNTFGSWNGSSCVAIATGINDRMCESTKTDASGHTLIDIRNTYNSQGFETASTVWTGSSWLTTNYSPNTNGTVASKTDPQGAVSTYFYNGTGGCNNLLLTSTSVTPQSGDTLTSSQTWNCNGAVTTQVSDPNGQPTNYTYNDPLWRITSMTDALGNVTNYSYPTPTTFETVMNFNGTVSTSDTLITTDGLGRQIFSQTRQAQGSTTFDTVQTTYGWTALGPSVTTTVPYSGTQAQPAPSGTGSTTTQGDATSRPISISNTGGGVVNNTYAQNDVLSVLGPAPSGEHTKQTQTEYDGLGRVTKLCHIGSTTNTGSGTACSQNTGSANGATDAYTYGQGTGYTTVSIQRGSQTRTNTYDALGRTTKKITPEGGTWTYNFDTADGCTASNGNLTESSDPNGNGICYYYDSLNRLIEASANTANIRHFVYDTNYGTIPTGVSTPTNTLGRLAEAYTTNGSGTVITDEWFSYDKDGRMTDYWQSTPHSTQYYHSKATFYGNGAVNTLQLASPSLYTITYGLDGEGRFDTLKDGSTTIVAGPTTGGMYDPAGHVLNVQLTGTTPDQDIYTYDPNTGKMKTFEFEVGNTPANLTGTITWNPNGTVAHVAVVDGFNAGGSSTCYSDSNSSLGYGYDDWGRLMSFDCGSGNVGENYSYDLFDNLNMAIPTGRTGWTLSTTYNSSTNQMTGNTYDSNGNTTADGGSNTYGYDEFSKVKWTAASGTPTCGATGKCVTYDAFGRMVETSAGSVWTELWYPQVPGARVSMSGTAQSFGYWPSPGRGVYLEQSSKAFLHQDWLGNDRIVSSFGTHTAVADRDYTPYGQQFNAFGGTNPVYGLFAEMPGDYNAGTLFDTPNREFAVNQVRWLNPDPAGSGWNQYAYPTDPNSNTDPTGLAQGRGPHVGCSASISGYCPWQSIFSSVDAVQLWNLPVVTERHWIEAYKYWSYWNSYPDTPGDMNSPEGDLVTVRGHYGDVVLGTLGTVAETHPGLAALYDSADCPTCGQTLRRAAGTVKAVTVGYAAGFTILAGGAAAYTFLPTMEIAVGAGEPFHVAYGVGGTWLNAVGSTLGDMTVSAYMASDTAATAWFTISVPILNEAAVLATEGCPAFSCATAAVSALAKGWIP